MSAHAEHDQLPGLYAELLQREGELGVFQKEGGNLGYFKNRGGRSCKRRQGEHWKTMWSPTAHKSKFKASS